MAVAEMVPTQTPTRVEPAPLPPLTAPQQRLVLAELHAYFAGFWPRYPYQQPTFRAEVQWYDRDNLPDDASAGTVLRRAPGAVPDPTYWQAMTLLFGPGKVPLWRGERVPVQPEEFQRMARLLPTHLAVPFRRCILARPSDPTTFMDLGQELQISRNTVKDYCDTATAVLAQWLYPDRWTIDGEKTECISCI